MILISCVDIGKNKSKVRVPAKKIFWYIKHNMSDMVSKESKCETRQSDAKVREEIAERSSVAARLGIMAPTGDGKVFTQKTCPSVTGASCAVNFHPVAVVSSKNVASTPKCM